MKKLLEPIGFWIFLCLVYGTVIFSGEYKMLGVVGALEFLQSPYEKKWANTLVHRIGTTMPQHLTDVKLVARAE